MSHINLTGDNAKLARYSGDVYVYPIDGDGNKTALGTHIGHATAFAIGAPETEDVQEKSRATGNYGESLRTEPGEITQTVTFITKTNNLDNFQLALGGDVTDLAQAAGNDATPQAITAELGKVARLNARNLDPANMPLVQDDGDTITYVLDTDYEIDTAAGMIKFLEGGSIAESDVIHVTSEWLQYDQKVIEANQNLDTFYAIEVVNQNEIDEVYGFLEFPKCTVKASGDISRLAEDETGYTEIPMTATLSLLGGKYFTLSVPD